MSSLIYPALLLMLSCCVIGVLVGYVIPKFSEFYKGFAGQLPLITVILVAVAKFVRANGIWIVPASSQRFLSDVFISALRNARMRP